MSLLWLEKNTSGKQDRLFGAGKNITSIFCCLLSYLGIAFTIGIVFSINYCCKVNDKRCDWIQELLVSIYKDLWYLSRDIFSLKVFGHQSYQIIPCLREKCRCYSNQDWEMSEIVTCWFSRLSLPHSAGLLRSSCISWIVFSESILSSSRNVVSFVNMLTNRVNSFCAELK